MAYSRRVVKDYETVMNKDLYDNLQDGIDELKQSDQELNQKVEKEVSEIKENQEALEQGLVGLGQDLSSVVEGFNDSISTLDGNLQSISKDLQSLENNVGDIASEAGGIKFDSERDMILVKNPYTGEWIDYQSSGVIVLPSTITVTTTTLGGQAVTCVTGDESYTTTFIVTEGTSGVAVFTVYSEGISTITCGEFSVEVEVTKASEQLTVENNSVQNGATYKAEYKKVTYEANRGDFIGKTLKFYTDGSINKVKVYITVSYVKTNATSGQASYYFIENNTLAQGIEDIVRNLPEGIYYIDFEKFENTTTNVYIEDIRGFSIQIYSDDGMFSYGPFNKIWLE